MDAINRLLVAAREARENAYAPYSRFSVGAALLTADGEIFTGCNVENLSFGLTLCAERVAAFSAVAAGKREFTGLALITDTPQPVTPCGSCRQVLYEFSPDLWIISANLEGKQQMYRLQDLLPDAFSADF
ncbi:cytidine deaminase [Dethiobacter alkaliphilus]|uniref:Cytidine deaminase n=1 Tax=Dethiobacter alkaliphilus AHT 1 TaxID=555088 RepID=C0GEJ5_DETAL|nr:cytidine deaminase [Dethiobacter alkaliphilus]EEG78027.1 cytidine deaminase [Dethiobacter alkaliphilus AHT 1]